MLKMIKKTTLQLMTLEELSFLLNVTAAALIVVPKEEYADIDFVRSEIENIMRQKEEK